MGIAIIVLSAGLVIITSGLFEQGLVTVGEIVLITGIALRAVSIVWELGAGTISFIRERGAYTSRHA